MKNNNLKEVYDTIAEKYYSSRNKHRNDWIHILNEIQKYWKKEISILEFWCWWGRCIKYLNENLKWIKINYTWIDISKELLKYAKKDNQKDKFICKDISKYIPKVTQEQFDFIIWIASFQHIEQQNERLSLMRNFYRTLKYWGKLIMTNRSLSNRFSQKYYKEIFKSIIKTIYTFWNHKRNDLFIPRKNNWKLLYRFYHIFSTKELELLCKESWFSINKLTFLNKNWKEINEQKSSNNTILIWEKSL
jgi:SAM-dependent methyltransferase